MTNLQTNKFWGRFIRTMFGLVCAVMTLASCASLDVSTYAKESPQLRLEEFFNGKLVGHGMVMDRSGEVTRRFVVNITGTLGKDASGTETLTLDEKFDWSDGKKETRVWTLKRISSSAGQALWSGSAADVVGTAVGKVAGNALQWRYVLALPYKESTINLDFDDWMFLIDDKVMLNKAVFSKYGVRLGEILISFQK